MFSCTVQDFLSFHPTIIIRDNNKISQNSYFSEKLFLNSHMDVAGWNFPIWPVSMLFYYWIAKPSNRLVDEKIELWNARASACWSPTPCACYQAGRWSANKHRIKNKPAKTNGYLLPPANRIVTAPSVFIGNYYYFNKYFHYFTILLTLFAEPIYTLGHLEICSRSTHTLDLLKEVAGQLAKINTEKQILMLPSVHSPTHTWQHLSPKHHKLQLFVSTLDFLTFRFPSVDTSTTISRVL